MKQGVLEKIRQVLIILLNHLLVIAGIITIYDLFQIDGYLILICILSLVIPFGYYFVTNRPQKLLYSPLFIVFLQIMSASEKIMKKNDWEIYYLVIAFVYLAGYFLCYFLSQYTEFLLLNKSSASNIPEQDMLQRGVKQTMVFGSISTLVLLLTLNFDLIEKIADRIWSWILWLLRCIFSGIDTQPPVEEPPMEERYEATADIGSVIDREMFPPFIKESAKMIAVGLVFIAFVGGCILLILLIYEFIKKYFSPLKQKKKNKLQTNDDIREFCGVEKNTKKQLPVLAFLKPRERIRRLYQKKVLKRKEELVGKNTQQLEYMTAKECCDRLAEQNLKQMYEKARYSIEDISAEDVRYARNGK